VKEEEMAPHSQGCNETVNRTADREPTLPQLSINICCRNVVRELEIDAREESKEARGLTILGVIPNALQDFLDDNTASGNVFSLGDTFFLNLSFARGFATKEVDPH
jgi:hypothetical protein